jgi:hypothetical protein
VPAVIRAAKTSAIAEVSVSAWSQGANRIACIRKCLRATSYGLEIEPWDGRQYIYRKPTAEMGPVAERNRAGSGSPPQRSDGSQSETGRDPEADRRDGTAGSTAIELSPDSPLWQGASCSCSYSYSPSPSGSKSKSKSKSKKLAPILNSMAVRLAERDCGQDPEAHRRGGTARRARPPGPGSPPQKRGGE